MKTSFAVTLAAALALGSAASAETFTGVFKNDPATLLTAPGPTPAATQLGAYWKGTSTSTSKSGVVTTSTYTCVGWSTPNAATDTAAVCEGADNATDKYAINLVCAANDPKDPSKGAMCWGALIGTGGKYAGKHGNFAQFSSVSSGTNEGAWSD